MPDGSKLRLSQDIHLESAVGGVFLERALAQGLKAIRLDSWQTAERSLAPLGDPTLRFSAERRETALYERDGSLVLVARSGSHLHAVVAGSDAGAAETELERLHELLHTLDPSAAHEVTVTFWTYSRHGPQPSWRSIAVPEWDEIRENYAASTREALEAIMRDFTPAHGGQLVLWHGEAGTGKTFALRALAWEWREWCEFNYIVDPDSFFGEHADYLMSVLMQEGSPMAQMRQMVQHAAVGGGWMGIADGDEEEEEAERAWRVLVLEDTGELLSADARVVIGQGLSRFLNVVDGLIGQGLRVLVLVTTNEEIEALHPAVARPGRCAANIDFEPLSRDEAAAWLARREIDYDAGGGVTLAELYARAEGRDPELAEFG